MYEYLKSQDNISRAEFVRIGNDFYFIVDVFNDYATSCYMELKAFNKAAWKKNRCLLYQRKVLPFMAKIEFIGRKWMEPNQNYNLTNDQQLSFDAKARTTLLTRRFDFEFKGLIQPYKLYEVIK